MSNETPWSTLAAGLTRLSDRLDALPSIREATVSSMSPLAVRFDTDTVDTLIQGSLTASVAVGDRALTLKLRHYVWIVGVKGGPARRPQVMVPTSVVGGVFDPVTGRAALDIESRSWTLDGVFTDEFSAYRVTYSIYTPDNVSQLRLRLRDDAGVDIAGAGYFWTNTITSPTPALDVASSSSDINWVPDQGSGSTKSGYFIVKDPRTMGTSKKGEWYTSTNLVRQEWHTQGSGMLFDYDDVKMGGFTLFLYGGTQSVSQPSWILVEPIPSKIS